jgi:hypothetical protein
MAPLQRVEATQVKQAYRQRHQSQQGREVAAAGKPSASKGKIKDVIPSKKALLPYIPEYNDPYFVRSAPQADQN